MREITRLCELNASSWKTSFPRLFTSERMNHSYTTAGGIMYENFEINNFLEWHQTLDVHFLNLTPNTFAKLENFYFYFTLSCFLHTFLSNINLYINYEATRIWPEKKKRKKIKSHTCAFFVFTHVNWFFGYIKYKRKK